MRLIIEATGNYSLDLALTVHASENIELMVANPSATRQFAGAQMRRSKTDCVDADVLADFAARMAFVPWEPPEEAVLELRGIARRMQALQIVRSHAQMKAAPDRLTSVRGIADKSAVMILPEILILPDDMSVRKWVAHAGLDPESLPPATRSKSESASQRTAMCRSDTLCICRPSSPSDGSLTSAPSTTT